MARENLKAVLRSSDGLTSSIKLVLALAVHRYPRIGFIALAVLRLMARRDRVWISYRKEGRTLRAALRFQHFDSDKQTFLELGSGDCYELADQTPPDLVVDGGGNIGLFSLAAKALWPNSEIVICEPLPENLHQLYLHLGENRCTATVLPCCLAASDRKRELFCREANRASFSTNELWHSVITVQCLKLSNIVPGSEQRQVLIKLDIEGAETEVLEEFLSMPRPNCTIVGELHYWREHKARFLEVLRRAGWKAEFRDAGDGICLLFRAWPKTAAVDVNTQNQQPLAMGACLWN